MKKSKFKKNNGKNLEIRQLFVNYIKFFMNLMKRNWIRNLLQQ